MQIFRAKSVPIPQDLSLMPTSLAINKQTIIQIQVRLPDDIDEEVAFRGSAPEGECLFEGEKLSLFSNCLSFYFMLFCLWL